MFRFTSFLGPLAILILGLAIPLPYAHASPIYFEEDFSGCTVGGTPAGWTHSNVGVGTIQCANNEFFPGPEPFPTYQGSPSFQQRLTASLIDGWLSPTFSIGGATTLSLGFAVRFENFSTSTFGGAWQFTFRDTSTATGGFGVNDLGDVSTLDNGITWQDTGFNVVLNTWYVVRFDLNRAANQYDTYINGTLEDSNQATPSADDVDTVFFSGRLSSQAWVDWIFTDQLTMATIPDQTLQACLNEVSIPTPTDASSDVIFNLSEGPAFLTVGQQTGQVTGNATASGTFLVNVTANVSTGQVFETYNLIVPPCNPGSAATTFGPAWVAFFAAVGIMAFIVFRFKLNFDRRKKRQGKTPFTRFFKRGK